MEEQVITIGEGGTVESLQHKKGLDLRTLGKVQIERVSEVLFHEDKQQFYVKFLKGALEGRLLSRRAHVWAGEDGSLEKVRNIPPEDVQYFDTYDEGVQAEIAALNFLKVHGGHVNASYMIGLTLRA